MTQAQPEVETLIYNPTINQQIRNRRINRNEYGLPINKEFKDNFTPVNPAESKQSIKNDNFTLFDNDYNLTRQHKIEDLVEKKQKMVGPEFKRTYNFDNATGADWTQSNNMRKTEFDRKRA